MKCLFICCDLTSNAVILQLYSDETLVINIKDMFHLHKKTVFDHQVRTHNEYYWYFGLFPHQTKT